MSEQASKFVQHFGSASGMAHRRGLSGSLSSSATTTGSVANHRGTGSKSASFSSANSSGQHRPGARLSASTAGGALQVRRTLRVKIRKNKPILGIAIEGGFNVSGQLLPRIVCVHVSLIQSRHYYPSLATAAHGQAICLISTSTKPAVCLASERAAPPPPTPLWSFHMIEWTPPYGLSNLDPRAEWRPARQRSCRRLGWRREIVRRQFIHVHHPSATPTPSPTLAHPFSLGS